MKIETILAVLVIFVQVSSYAQTKCSCALLVDPDYKGKIEILSAPGGRLKKSMQHNFKEEDMIVLNATTWQGDYLQVSAEHAINGSPIKGWVKLSPVIGIYSRNYAENLVLHDQPGANNKKVVVIGDYINTLIKVIGCNGQWVKVVLYYNGKNYTGWISPDMQCANPYSTCS